MTPERWSRILEIFHEAVALPHEEQQLFIARACDGDDKLLSDVRGMLAADVKSTAPVKRVVAEMAAQVVSGPPRVFGAEDFDAYVLGEKLGDGGMGVVFLARHKTTGQKVAIKIGRYARVSEPSIERFRERFRQEQRILANLIHPYIAQLYNADVLEDGTPWFAMEYVEGVTLSEYCLNRRLSIRERLGLARLVCEAVRYVHSGVFVHRDLKPSNILVTEQGIPKLLDFGISKALSTSGDSGSETATNDRRMTIAYASPEQVRGEAPSVLMDVYSLGVIIYELLAGQHPIDFSNLSSGEAERKITEHDVEQVSAVACRNPLNAGLSKAEWRDLDVLCASAMHKDTKKRYQSVEALIRDLDHFLKCEPLEARRDTLPYRVSKFARRHRAGVILVTAAALLVVALTTVYTIGLKLERNRAEAETQRSRRIEQFTLDLLGNQDELAPPSKDLTVIEALDRGAAKAELFRSDPNMLAEIDVTLGRVYAQQSQFAKAEKLLNEAFTLTRGKDSEQSLRVLIQLGLLKGDQAADQAQLDEAAKLLGQAVEMGKRMGLAANHRLMLNAQSSLGRVLIQGRDSKEGIPILEAIVRRPAEGEDEKTILLESITALAVADQNIGKFEEAEVLNLQALKLDRERQHGNTHPRVAQDLANIASAVAAQGRYEEALNFYRESAGIFAANYGADNPQVVQVRSFAAKMALATGRIAEAEQLLKDVLPKEEKIFGTRHPIIAFTHDVLGELDLKRGELQKAEREFTISFEMNRGFFGEADNRSASVLTDLSATLLKESRYAEAERNVRRAIKVFTDHPRPHNLTLGSADLILGDAILKQKRYREAEEPLIAAHAILIGGKGDSAMKLNDCLADLQELYRSMGMPAKAQAVQAEMSQIRSGSHKAHRSE